MPAGAIAAANERGFIGVNRDYREYWKHLGICLTLVAAATVSTQLTARSVVAVALAYVLVLAAAAFIGIRPLGWIFERHRGDATGERRDRHPTT
jgi:hypothetical protein